ncbi:MarR family winged helix-turn-helix transcriptional regulator [Arthrobacter sp. B1805]|uniref:MarR family winged helix-turn-helix transcriptional regulator n=1 Tax=Arthrobacter sp. B1805 TaxID=2058892 RepID=UPI0011B04270|nr:MarR family transcriptional regulator [Arthrobacter sp. B1805]
MSLHDSTTPSGAPSPVAGSDEGRLGEGRLDELVDAVRRYRNAERFMRGQSRASMHLGRTDMTALRLMLHASQIGQPLTAAALARELDISTAATTVLIDRLEKSGHAERRRKGSDGRSIEIWPTATTDGEVRSTMGPMHERMLAIATDLSPQERLTVRRFLAALGSAMADLDVPRPAPGTSGT